MCVSIFICIQFYVLVMQTAWRERDPEARVKAAHQALEKNAEYAIFLNL